MGRTLSRLFLLLLLLPAPAFSQAAEERGRAYHVHRYTPEEYGLHDQNWASVQGEHGLLYVANRAGVLEFDGEAWRTIHVPNEFARSLALGTDGRVYVGVVGEIGYLAPDSSGATRYVSLLRHVPEAHRTFADVWTTHVTPEGIYFQAFSHLFRWDGQAMQVWTTESRFHKAFAVDGALFVREEGRGLLRVEGDRLQLVEGGERFADEAIDVLLPHGPEALLVGTRERGFWRWERGRLTRFPTEADAYLESRRLYAGTALSDELYALTTLSGSAFLMDREGEVRAVLDENVGLEPDDLVLDAAGDRQGGLWLALGDGLLRVDVLSPLTVFDASSGLEGTVRSLARHRGRLFAATSQGIYRLQPGRKQARGRTPIQPPRFERIEEARSWSILSVGDALLVATDRGVYVRDERGGRFVGDGKAFVLTPSATHPGRVYVGRKDGLGLLERRPGEGWAMREVLEEAGVEVRSVQEDASGTLWLGTLYSGVLRVGLEEGEPAEVKRLTPEVGLPEGPVAAMTLKDEVVLLTREGLYRPARRDGALGVEPLRTVNAIIGFDGEEHVYLRVDDAGRLWVEREHRVELYEPIPGGGYREVTPPALRVPGLDVRTVHPDVGGVVWLSTDDRLLRYDPRVERPYTTPYDALVRSVEVKDEGLLYAGAPDAASALEIPYLHNNLRFTFSAPTFNAPEQTQYQYWLVGFDGGWSPWGDETLKEYTNLPEGDYAFHVRARSAQGVVSRPATYTFTVLPPWYRTWWAYFGYVVAGTLIVWGYGRMRLRHHLRQLEHERLLNQQLETANARLQQANERLHHADKLKDNFLANTSHELRTPLTAILGFADVLKEELDGEGREFADRIYHSGERLLDTVNALLDMARLQADLMELDPVELDVVEEARQVAQMLLPQAQAKGLYLKVLPEAAEVPARMDPASLERVLVNLVGNAVKFTEEGGVSVLVDADEEAVYLTVRDTGIGIREEFLPALFSEFEQASSGYGRTYEGSGLGLAITQRIVHLLGGDIEVESRVGGGTIFRLRLPRYDRSEGTGEVEATPAGLHGCRVLLVEAAARPQSRVRHLLDPVCELDTVTGVVEALEAAGHHRYDLLLLDGHLDVLPDGRALLDALRALPNTADAPAVALTAYAMPGDRDRFLARGYADLLGKPVTTGRLLLALEGALVGRVPAQSP